MIYAIVLAVMLLSWLVQHTLNSRFEEYSHVPSPHSLTGADVARMMLQQNGITDVEVKCIEGTLTDHFNPSTKVINLSTSVYQGANIASCAVAAHETGHALQHALGYGPLKLRTALVPVVNLASKTVQWVLLAGVIVLSITPSLLYLGIALFAMTTLFSIVTLPVEINASQRAVAWLRQAGITDASTTPLAQDALKWAAYTYVIAALGSLATLLYYISLANRRN